MQKLYNLRDSESRSLIEHFNLQDANDTVLELLNNPQGASVAYPDVERAVQASIDDKPRQARLKYGLKGCW